MVEGFLSSSYVIASSVPLIYVVVELTRRVSVHLF